MKTLIIGDIHNHVDKLETLIGSIEHDQVIFLGDYFDNFHDSIYDARTTASWLEYSTSKKNRIHLMGNHDMPYRFPSNLYFDCPGFTREKSKMINSIFNRYETSIWSKIKFAHFDYDSNIIYSHAGFTEKVFRCHPIKGPNLKEYNKMVDKAYEALVKDDQALSPLFCQNIDDSYSGITWIRPNSFKNITGVAQFVGHTPTHIITNCGFNDAVPVIRESDGGVTFYMDCAHSWVGLLESNNLKFINRHTMNEVQCERSILDYINFHK